MIETQPDPGLVVLLGKVGGETGLGCSAYKQSCLRRRIAVRMRACRVQTYAEYEAVLDREPEEYERLLDTLTINVTKFYRNRDTWETLATRVLPDLWQRCNGSVRCWSAGCSSGEEPYTLVILLLELSRRGGNASRLVGRVDATDLDRESIAKAQEGRYRDAAFEEMPPALVVRYFSEGRPKTILPSVKQNVRFQRHDIILEPPPDPPYHLIICRNVLIYFDRPTQERLLWQFADALTPGGYLVLGKTETLFGTVRERLELVAARERIYRLP
ncbi:MAG: CheR family methyltransferase [Gemmatimonadales bacterium]